jgi:DNA-binding response OmpR family regulator
MLHKKILLVDDNDDYSKLLTRNLNNDGFETRVATNGKEALELVSNSDYSPDLFLIDLMMPQMDGIELLHNLKTKKLSKDSKICVLTAKNDISEIGKAFDLGAHEYFLKSDNLLVMLEKLYELMEIDKRPIPDKRTDFVSVLEVTNVIHDFKIVDFNENTVKFISAEEVPLNATIQIKNEKLKSFKNTSHPISCQVQECRLIEDEIIITCNFLDQAA